MGVPFGVHVGDAAHQLLKYVFACVFGQALVRHLFDVMVNAHTLAKLHDQMNMCPLIDNFMKFHNARMPEVRKCVDLSVDSLLSFPVLQILLIVGFYGDHMFCLFVDSTSYYSESTLTNLEVNLKFSKAKRLLVGVLFSA